MIKLNCWLGTPLFDYLGGVPKTAIMSCQPEDWNRVK